jgi:AAA15 family ATPase/GTPase
MKIIQYRCDGRGEDDDWVFSPVEFGKVNLLVGDTATGKTRFLNTLFNIGTFVSNDEFKRGLWDVVFEQNNSRYSWKIESTGIAPEARQIISERLVQLQGDQETLIIDRTADEFYFKGNKLPKLTKEITALSLLKGEEEIRPLHEGFGRIRRRRFSLEALSQIAQLEPIAPDILQEFQSSPTEDRLYKSQLGLNATLYVLSIHFQEVFDKIRAHFQAAFPFVVDTRMLDFNQLSRGSRLAFEIPLFCIKEKSGTQWIPITEASSGMQKVLLILTDAYTLPTGSIYIIDEYENSLGVNAIDFFPNFLLEFDRDIQFFLTSHHPYIINEIPPRNWYVFHRKGTTVTIKYGEEIEKRFGKSKQRAFIQLINDSFYTEGVE